MDGVRSTTARYRAPDALLLPGDTPAGPEADFVKRPLPVAAAILWTPAHDSAVARVEYPIFISQSALAALHAHVGAKPRGTDSLGFLAGHLLECPDSGTRYVIIESAIHLPWSISGDHLRPALLQGWTVVQEEVRKNGGQLLGWYHTHLAVEPTLSPADVDTHVALFDRPWQVALVITPGDPPAGGLFRIAPDGTRANQYLPFYELLDATSVLPDGRKVSDLAWPTYRTEEPIFSSDRVSNPGLPIQSHLLFPAEVAELETPPTQPARRSGVERTLRIAGYGGLVMVAAAVLFNVYRARASGPATPLAGRPLAGVSPREHVDRTADTVALALAAFDLRTRLFDGRKMACDGLARGLVDLEERWTVYNTARKGDPAALDSVRNVRDRSLYADVDAAERRFERSRCPRP
jgi:hypothetical protein